MSNLRSAIEYIESRMDKRASLFARCDSTALTIEEANHVLNLLRTHDAEEDTLQFDMEMEEANHRRA